MRDDFEMLLREYPSGKSAFRQQIASDLVHGSSSQDKLIDMLALIGTLLGNAGSVALFDFKAGKRQAVTFLRNELEFCAQNILYDLVGENMCCVGKTGERLVCVSALSAGEMRPILQTARDKMMEYFGVFLSYTCDDVDFSKSGSIQQCARDLKGFKNSPVKNDLLIYKAIKYIERNYADCGLSLPDVSDFLGVSESYLCREFKRINDISFSEFVADFRIQKSKQLLMETDLSICAIAGMVGFNSQHYFAKVFKKGESITPSEYRSGSILE